MNRIYRGLSVGFLWLAVVLGVGCATDAVPEVGRDCVVRSDCAPGLVCGAGGVCLVADKADGGDVGGSGDAEGTCRVADCDEIPGPMCEGDLLVTFDALCDEGACAYPSVATISCEFGCADGACKGDPCEAIYCDAPPADRCEGADTLVAFESVGVCGGGECTYAASETVCVHGCSNGACNVGACDQATCQSPPRPTCDGNTGRVWAQNGQCVEENGRASCRYDLTFNNCDYVAGQCNPSSGTCINTAVEVGGAAVVEIMANPGGISDAEGEWFEVLNTSGASLSFDGWVLRSGTSGQTVETHPIQGAGALAAGGRFIFANGPDPAGDGSVVPDYQYVGITLSNTTDWLELVNVEGKLVDRVFWEAGSVMDASSRKLDPDRASPGRVVDDNNDFANWCPELSDGYGVHGNRGTPGAANPACQANPCAQVHCEKPADFCTSSSRAVQYRAENATCQVSRFQNPYCDFQPTEVRCEPSEYCMDGACNRVPGRLPEPGEIVFTEFMGAPEGIADARGEYMELYNTTDEALTLFTLVIEDNETGRSHDQFSIEEPTATIAAQGYAVLVADTDPALNGGITGGLKLADSPLKNAPGEAGLVITLRRQDGVTIDQAHYGTPIKGVSQQLSLDVYSGGATNVAQSNDAAANFCPATRASAAYAASGQLGSPGAANENCP